MGKAIRISDLNLSREKIGQVTPASFNRLQYISSTGTQYIDTGVQSKSGLHIIIKLNITQPSSPFGGQDGFGINGFSYMISSRAIRRPYMLYGNQVYQLANDTATGGPFTFDFNDNVWAIKTLSGDRVWLTHEFNVETFASGSNIYLFSICQDGSINGHFWGRIYECQIYDGNTLLRDYVAVERVQDGKAGLYDNVYNVFYPNQGTGEFEKGPYAE